VTARGPIRSVQEAGPAGLTVGSHRVGDPALDMHPGALGGGADPPTSAAEADRAR
jgi:hypothetical protein